MSEGIKSKLFKEYFECIIGIFYGKRSVCSGVQLCLRSYIFLFIMLFNLSLLKLIIFFSCLDLCLVVNRLLVSYLHPVT